MRFNTKEKRAYIATELSNGLRNNPYLDKCQFEIICDETNNSVEYIEKDVILVNCYIKLKYGCYVLPLEKEFHSIDDLTAKINEFAEEIISKFN